MGSAKRLAMHASWVRTPARAAVWKVRKRRAHLAYLSATFQSKHDKPNTRGFSWSGVFPLPLPPPAVLPVRSQRTGLATGSMAVDTFCGPRL